MNLRQAMMTIASLCLMAALCEQLAGGSRLFGAVRMFLGLEIVRAAMAFIDGFLRILD